MEEIKGAVQHASSKVYCNCCGREINAEGREREDYLQVAKAWGYFSNKDLTGHTFNVCENCYDQFVASFVIPVEEYPVDDMPMYTDAELRALNEAYAKEFSK